MPLIKISNLKSQISKYYISIFSFLLFTIYSIATPALADDLGPGPAGVLQLQELIQRIINIAVGAAFVVLLIMLIYAGIKFLTSGGEPKALGQASGTITWALLGILFLIIAWLILKLIEAFTGVHVTQFCIGFAPFCP